MYKLHYVLLLICGFTFKLVSAQSPRPNIMLVIGDDMRFDTYGPTGGPTWFSCASINRVANEGANFENYFCVYSLCIPSRSSIMTGLYPHSNGAYDNISTYNSSLPTIASILHGAGYHTAMIGKFHAYYSPQPGWDYWLSKYGETDYTDPKFNYNGTTKIIYGHTTAIINDSSEAVLAAIDTPFFMNIGHLVAHKNIVPEPQYDGIYHNKAMPIPSDFYKYPKDYPSFLYERGYYLAQVQLNDDYEKYFEGVRSIDDNMDSIFSILQSRGLLGNTLIIFTSDNGSMYGEHLLAGKGVAYDPSIRQPMFIRYPAWFSPGTEIANSIGLHVDLAPTILEAAGIDATPYHFQGISLHKQATGELNRNLMLYENIKLYADEGNDDVPTPSIRSVRDFNYKYISYQCQSVTEEFFDLTTDPMENTNLIHDPSYAVLIDQYRNKLDSMRAALSDTLSIDTLEKSCYLKTSKKFNAGDLGHTGDIFHLRVSPNPVQDEFFAEFFSGESGNVRIQVYNNLGQVMYDVQSNVQAGLNEVPLNGQAWPPGLYYLRVQSGDKVVSESMAKRAVVN